MAQSHEGSYNEEEEHRPILEREEGEEEAYITRI